MIKKISELVVGKIYQAVTGRDEEFAYLFMYNGGNLEADGTVYTNGIKFNLSGSLNIHTNSSFKYYLEATSRQQESYYQITDTKPQQFINFLP